MISRTISFICFIIVLIILYSWHNMHKSTFASNNPDYDFGNPDKGYMYQAINPIPKLTYPSTAVPYAPDMRDLPPSPPRFYKTDPALPITQSEYSPVGHNPIGALTPVIDFDSPDKGVVPEKPIVHNTITPKRAEEASDLGILGGTANDILGARSDEIGKYKYSGHRGLNEYSDGDTGGDVMPTIGTARSSYSFAPDQAALWHNYDNSALGYLSSQFTSRGQGIDYGDRVYSGGIETNLVKNNLPKSLYTTPDNDVLLGEEENYDTGTREGTEYIRYMHEGSSGGEVTTATNNAYVGGANPETARRAYIDPLGINRNVFVNG